MKNEEALKKVGLDYSSFDEKEVATIINKVILEKIGIAKARYVKLLNNISEPAEFVQKVVKYGRFTYGECDDLILDIEGKKEDMKADELKKAKEELVAIQARIKELEK